MATRFCAERTATMSMAGPFVARVRGRRASLRTLARRGHALALVHFTILIRDVVDELSGDPPTLYSTLIPATHLTFHGLQLVDLLF